MPVAGTALAHVLDLGLVSVHLCHSWFLLFSESTYPEVGANKYSLQIAFLRIMIALNSCSADTQKRGNSSISD